MIGLLAKAIQFRRKQFEQGVIEVDGRDIKEVTEEKLMKLETTDSREKISMVLDKMKDVLFYKNEKYGDSALHPKKCFYKGDSTNSIKIRLDDKISRVENCDETRINDVADIIGYCTLLLVSMNVKEDDLEKLKD